LLSSAEYSYIAQESGGKGYGGSIYFPAESFDLFDMNVIGKNGFKKRAVPAPTSEPLNKFKSFGARCTFFRAISYYTKKRAVPAPTSEPLNKFKSFGARCTFFRAISYYIKKLCSGYAAQLGSIRLQKN